MISFYIFRHFSAIELTYRGFKVFNWDKDCENPNAWFRRRKKGFDFFLFEALLCSYILPVHLKITPTTPFQMSCCQNFHQIRFFSDFQCIVFQPLVRSPLSGISILPCACHKILWLPGRCDQRRKTQNFPDSKLFYR